MSSLALNNFLDFSEPRFLHLLNGFNNFWFSDRIKNNNEKDLATSLYLFIRAQANDGDSYSIYF